MSALSLGACTRTAFDAVHPGMPAALQLRKPLVLTARRLTWLRELDHAQRLTRKELSKGAGRTPHSYRTWFPMVEHGLIEASFDREWTFRITAKGHAALEQHLETATP